MNKSKTTVFSILGVATLVIAVACVTLPAVLIYRQGALYWPFGITDEEVVAENQLLVDNYTVSDDYHSPEKKMVRVPKEAFLEVIKLDGQTFVSLERLNIDDLKQAHVTSNVIYTYTETLKFPPDVKRSLIYSSKELRDGRIYCISKFTFTGWVWTELVCLVLMILGGYSAFLFWRVAKKAFKKL